VKTASTLIELLRDRALGAVGQPAYSFLPDGETEQAGLTWEELDRQARAIAARLQSSVPAGERVLLLYPPGLEFIAAFFGCIYAGLTAVPVYSPKLNRSLLRIYSIAEDAQATVALTTRAVLSRMTRQMPESLMLRNLRWLKSDSVEAGVESSWRCPRTDESSIAFLQYTSGSTGTPKGVILTHRNLLHNAALVHSAVGHTPADKYVSWLPTFHDMGFMAGILQPLYGGLPAVLMPPASFLEQPARWLRAISRHRATTSGGPNFAYDLCVRQITPEERRTLDLSSWSVAFNGAEPVRAETMEQFVRTFEPCGFRRESFYPCYGLAEATLMVSGGGKGVPPKIRKLRATALETHRVVESADQDGGARFFVSCGHPLAGQKVEIVHPDRLVRCLPGEVGEVWISGPSVAQGYWNSAGETERTFCARLADTGEGQFLRTGDLAFIKDGDLFITGRLKDIIIIRGLNHYPQDIEATVERSHADLANCSGAAFSAEIDGEERLVVVHEIHRRSGQDTDAVMEAILAEVAEEHELQVHAVVLVRRGSVPRTSSGKIRRQECRTLFFEHRFEAVAERRGNADAWRNQPVVPHPIESAEDIQAWLREEIAARAGLDPLSLDINAAIVRYGLDSLAATELTHRIEVVLGKTLPAADLLQGFSISEIARDLADLTPAGGVRTGDGGSEEIREFPLSDGQRALWFLHQLSPESPAYNIAVAARIRGPLNPDKLKRAFRMLADGHSSLRTVFSSLDGVPIQRILEQSTLHYHEENASAWSQGLLERRLTEEANGPFDLEKGPLFRVSTFMRSAEDHILVLVIHHIVADLWSLGVLVDELVKLYDSETTGVRSDRPSPRMQYADYVRWQKEMLSGPEGERCWAYWKGCLAGEDVMLDFPTDRPRPEVQTNRGDSVFFRFPAELSEGLKMLSHRHETTLYTTLMAAFQALLFRYTGQESIRVGSPTSGRGKASFASVVGYFVNPIVMSGHLSSTLSFADFLSQVRHNALSAFRHQDYPFALLVERLRSVRPPGRSPLFQAMFVWQKMYVASHGVAAFALHEEGAKVRIGSLTLESMALEQQAVQAELALMMGESGETLAASLQYNSDLLDRATMERFAAHFQTLIEGALQNPEQLISLLPLLREDERHQLLVAWNNAASRGPGTDDPVDTLFHHRFENQARKIPDAVALVFEEGHLTYRELDARANQLARYLRRIGVKPEVVAGVCVERSVEMVITLLGILKAGGACLPLDPGYPAARLEFMLTNARAEVLIVESRSASVLNGYSSRTGCLDADREIIAGESGDPLPCSTAPQNLAFIIYTSGSTGHPKGVAVEQKGVSRLLQWAGEFFGPQELAGVLASTSICFDLSIFELFVPLAFGGTIILTDSILRIGELPEADYATLINTVPSAMEALVTNGALPPSVRVVNLAGEALRKRLVDSIFRQSDRIRIYNLYGPSEDTVYSTFAEMKREDIGAPVIGRPIPGKQIYLLDEHFQPVPIGVTAEIYIGGDGAVRGYFDQPDLTGEKFLPDPFGGNSGARLYRTGDRARYLQNGNLEFLGRTDGQIKLRGFRIELGEIEELLRSHAAVKEAVVVAQDDAITGPGLVAYFVPAPDWQVTIGELTGMLRQNLPEHMTPRSYVALKEFPRMPNGKVNRGALPPAMEGTQPRPEGDFAGPRSPVEEALAEIFRSRLHLKRVGIHDSFFALGGHSLLAMSLLSQIRTVFQTELSVRDIFELPTVAGLAPKVQTAREGPYVTRPAIMPAARGSHVPLSFSQQRLWFIEQFAPGEALYIIAAAIELRGDLNIGALERSFNEIVRRHEVLRTGFVAVQGEPMQSIAPALHLPLPVHDLREWPEQEREAEVRRRAAAEAGCPFDLECAPLLRTSLLQLARQKHVLVLSMHHIISDGWSMGVMLRELSVLYEGYVGERESRLPELPIQYADYAYAQRQWLQGEVLQRQLSYWKKQLAGTPPMLELPTDHPRPMVQSYRGARQSLILSEAVTGKLRELGRSEGTTLFMTLLACFQTLLYRYTGQDDFVVGTPIAGRSRAETEGLIGFFVNTLALRTDLSGEPSFRELLGRVRETALEAYAHQELPFEKLVEELQPERSLSHSPLLQVMFALQNTSAAPLDLPGLRVDAREIESARAKYDLVLRLNENEEGLSGVFEYAADLFRKSAAEQMLHHFTVLLDSATGSPDERISHLPLMTGAERRQILADWNDSATGGTPNLSLSELFELQVARAPESIAIVDGELSLSYRELNRRANQAASYLRSLGAGRGVLIALCLRRLRDTVTSILAILKAGGVYLPLDPRNPSERMAWIIQDAKARVLLTSTDLSDRFPGHLCEVIFLDSVSGIIARHSDENLTGYTGREDLAYVMYTSGSTGTPKGIGILQQAVSRLVLRTDYAQLSSADRIAQVSNCSFDAATFEIWGALLNGARLVNIDHEILLSPQQLAGELECHQITTLLLITPLFNEAARQSPAAFGRIRQLLFGGEAAEPQCVRRVLEFGPPERLLHVYGPTENTTLTTWHLVEEVEPDAPAIPIGRPVRGNYVYIVDRHLEPVPRGVAGELCIGGAGLAMGYLNRTDLTAAAFVPNPFSKEAGARMYRTGDLVRCLHDGNIEFLARLDGQIKLRGFRIEPGEVERAMALHPAVARTVVAIHENQASEKSLVAYVVPHPGSELVPSGLRSHLRRHVPEYMVPSVFIVLERLPLTGNGKIDRQALRQLRQTRFELKDYFEAPRTPLEKTLADIWAEVLDIDSVGINDNFFALGGHSLIANQIVSRVNEVFEVGAPLRCLFEKPTIAELGPFIQELIVAEIAGYSEDQAERLLRQKS
jgi:amino acid adenylation domain-containing protein